MKVLRNRRVAVVTGDGVVGRSEHGLIIVHGHPDAIETLLADTPLESAAGVAQLRRLAAAGLPSGVGGLVIVTEDRDGIEITTSGPEHVSVDGIEPIPERHGDARVRLIRHTGVIRLGVALGHAGAAHDLREGLVPGSGVVLSAAEPRPAAAASEHDTDWDLPTDGLAAHAEHAAATPADRQAGGVTAFDAGPAIDPDPAGRSSLGSDPGIDPDPTTPASGRRPPTQLTEIQPPSEPQTTQIPPQPTSAPARTAGHTTFEIFDLSGTAHHRPPLPTAVSSDAAESDSSQLVQGILCSRQHFNNPIARYCQVCGISMAHATPNLVERPRPTLGFIVFDDGTTFALDRSYAIGRELPEVLDPDMTPLVIDDPEHSVSRRHAELRLDGWDVVVRDVGSSNGTRVWNPPTSSWQRLQTGEPLTLRDGTYVAVGRRVFVYEPAVRT